MKKTDLDPSVPLPTPSSRADVLQTINEKLDEILSYQRSAHRWAIIKGVINFILFMVLIVLPIVGLYLAVRSFVGQVDFGKLASQYHQATQLLDQINGMQGQLQNGAIQDLLKNLPALK